MLAAAGLLAGCALPAQSALTAFQRNVGPGSGVSGFPSDDLGSGRSGDEQVPGVSAAGSLGRN